MRPYARDTDNIENMVITLYKKGITKKNSKYIWKNLWKQLFSYYHIKHLKSCEKWNETYHNRKFIRDFEAFDTYLPVRRDSVAKEALHVIIGIDPNRNKKVLNHSLFPEESASNHKEMLINLKSRGLEKIWVFVSNGLILHEQDEIALKEAATYIFPKSKHQTHWTHLMRNIEK